MYVVRYFCGFIVLLSLVACNHSHQASQTNIQNETTETATLTNETTEQTPIVRPTKRPTPTSSVREAKEPVLVEQLPLDEPWISGGSNNLISVSDTGALQKLRVPVKNY